MNEFLNDLRFREKEKSGADQNKSSFCIQSRGILEYHGSPFFPERDNIPLNQGSADPGRITIDNIHKNIFTPVRNISLDVFLGENVADAMGAMITGRPRSLRLRADDAVIQRSIIADSKFLNSGPYC